MSFFWRMLPSRKADDTNPSNLSIWLCLPAADHGRESRHPFLDEAFVETILDLPLSMVANLEKPGQYLPRPILLAPV